MGFKTWAAGDVLTAADVNAYLMKQSVIVCTSGTRPASPIDGMTIYETDTDQLLIYESSKYVPVGPFTADACTVTAASPFVSGFGAGSATTELSSKMRLTAAKVYAGHLYRIDGTILIQQSGTGSDWTLYCREDTASGTIVGANYLPNVGLNGNSIAVRYDWVCASDASSKVFVFTAARNAGAQTLSVYGTVGGGQCLFLSINRVGNSAALRSVP